MYLNYFNLALNSVSDSRVKKAMAYSFYSSGKKLRSHLLIETVKAFSLDETMAYPAACSLEMIHTYSLIHDDLPAMDDDDLRRGMPTCHVQFDEATAILAGDGLLSEAFRHLSFASYSDEVKVGCIQILSDFAGANGMILGQDLDMGLQAETFEDLKRIHFNKTGKLFAAGFMMGAIVADKKEYLSLFHELGITLGLAFQIQDDILDVTMSSEELGKNANSDIENHKVTVLTFYDMQQAKMLLDDLFAQCDQLINQVDWDATSLKGLIEEIKNRRK
ncbi:MAG: farnesyl diphosphate synthase [Erysipelotrichaceae bacterium]